jgi:hypothetical protein
MRIKKSSGEGDLSITHSLHGTPPSRFLYKKRRQRTWRCFYVFNVNNNKKHTPKNEKVAIKKTDQAKTQEEARDTTRTHSRDS